MEAPEHKRTTPSPRPQKIGLLGGSFNPAHAGHVHLSQQALKHLQLDAVWWLVSPQNPLKSDEGMAPFDERLQHAEQLIAGDARIQTSDFEAVHGLQYTCDTLPALQDAYPQHHFVWLMGADNLVHFHRWRAWESILQTMPVAVFDRAPFSHAALQSKMAIKYRAAQAGPKELSALASCDAPAWAYIRMPRCDLSATELRKTLGSKAFLMA
ncbi:MAG: nicotinic acid mononucleotide adenylyltransferase [Rickettsiales bacterium]|nr:nicotinic acid mononucleotide adenylyltransferase [Rickettsiales bacterium]